jgi:sulfur carrier protein
VGKGEVSSAQTAATLRVSVNGEPRELPAGTTVAALLLQIAPAGKPCAVEIDRQIVPRSEHAGRTLREGEAVEVVGFVGGG